MSLGSPVIPGPLVDSGSSLPILIKAIWLVMKKRDFQNFGRILEFLELTHEQVPGLLCYMHHAKLSTGLRGKIVLHMIEENKPLLDILTALNYHFPPVLPDDSTVAQRKVFKVHQCKIHFRKLILRMIRDEKFRQNYVENTLHLEYGDTFMAVLEKLLWEFVCRLQAVLNHQVPQTTQLPEVDEDHLSSTPIHPSSGLYFADIPHVTSTKKTSNAKKKRASTTTHNVTSSDSEDENPHSVQKKQSYGRSEGGIAQAEASVQEPVGRTLDLFNSPSASGNIVDEPRPPYFEIFGFDCSQSLKVSHCEKLSPPNPLQSQGLDLDLEHASDPHSRHDVTRHVSFNDILVTDVADTLNHSPVSNHVQKSRGYDKGQDKTLAQGLMSWKYQPRVHLTKLPLNIVNKYVKQDFTQDETPRVVDSEQSQSESVPGSGSWFWLCSDPTDNDSNDPDYLPGHSFYHLVGEQTSRIQPKRGNCFSSLT
ncbi:TERF1-interacting nuclear factor 2 [Leptodactylus fuscus]|uniref:TERF1-interacting nuclear factor 2 n=1 Tax=Leptodactylus fuscus TaxID=238119 RepID=UPI003F4E630F